MGDAATDGAERTAQLDETWSSITDLGRSLSTSEWDLATDLPGWTVKDCLSHLVGTELGLLGEPAPDVSIDHLEHLTNPFSHIIEVWVEARRDVPGTEVLAEWEAAAARRLDALRALTAEDWSRVGWSPVGDAPYDTFMEVRVFDSWMHEQDMRRAVGRAGGLVGAGAAVSVGRVCAGLGFVVGKRAGAPEGAEVVFDVTGEEGCLVAVGVVDGRAKVLDEPSTSPTTRLAMDVETFCALGGGRWRGSDALDRGRVQVLGDRVLATAVLDGMAITP